MKHEIKSRTTGKVKFVADIDCEDDARLSARIGLAIRWGLENRADLRGADLSEANLRGADLSEANLRGADLRWADLRWADLRGANLRGADLRWADLRGANLRGADLRWADLSEANLSEAIGIMRVGPASDGWEFFGVVRDGDVWIKAGCRWFTASDARTHWQNTRPETALGAERIVFVDFIEATFKARGEIQ